MQKETIYVGLTIIATWFTLFMAEIGAALLARDIEGGGILYWLVVIVVVTIGILLIIFGLVSK